MAGQLNYLFARLLGRPIACCFQLFFACKINKSQPQRPWHRLECKYEANKEPRGAEEQEASSSTCNDLLKSNNRKKRLKCQRAAFRLEFLIRVLFWPRRAASCAKQISETADLSLPWRWVFAWAAWPAWPDKAPDINMANAPARKLEAGRNFGLVSGWAKLVFN